MVYELYAYAKLYIYILKHVYHIIMHIDRDYMKITPNSLNDEIFWRLVQGFFMASTT